MKDLISNALCNFYFFEFNCLQRLTFVIFFVSELYPDQKQDILKFRTYLSETSGELAPLKAWQFQELSLQAAQRIMSGPPQDAIQTFIHIAQNFPTQVNNYT